MAEPHVHLLSQLVSIPSVNPMGQPVSGSVYLETALTAFLEDWLRPLDLETRRQPVSPGRENLLATYHAPGASRHVLFEVHQDTVPVEGMVIAPFAGKVEGDRLYGRGACDNKGPMTAMLLALRRLAQEKPAGSASVTLALTVDEEHGFTGIAELVAAGLSYDCAIVAEPTNLDIVVAHKGVLRWRLATSGRACHSSTPQHGVNAIYRMGKVLVSLERFAAELGARPGDPLLGSSTISVGRISGGVSVNIVPDACAIEIDRRLIPGEDVERAQQEVLRYLAADPTVDFDVQCEPPWLQVLPMGNERNRPLTAALGRVIRQHRGDCANSAVAFGTDAAAINAAGIPVVVFGPGSIQMAHTKDEWVPLDEVAMAADIYFDFCARDGVEAMNHQ